MLGSNEMRPELHGFVKEFGRKKKACPGSKEYNGLSLKMKRNGTMRGDLALSSVK